MKIKNNKNNIIIKVIIKTILIITISLGFLSFSKLNAQEVVPYQENPILDIKIFIAKKDSLTKSEMIIELKIIISKIEKRIKYLISEKTLAENEQKETEVNTSSENTQSIENNDNEDSDEETDLTFNTKDKIKEGFLKSTYFVKRNGDIKAFNNQEISDEDEDAWYKALDILSPETIQKHLNVFRVYNTDIETSNEGYYAASVVPTIADYWELNVNLNYYDNTDSESVDNFYATLIHELAHILSLNKGQFSKKNNLLCTTIFIEQRGCLKETSPLYLFKNKFWKRSKDLRNSRILKKLIENENFEGFERRMSSHFRKNKKRFFTPYSTTSLVEDFAESYTAYVLLDLSGDKSNNINIQKANFMNDFESLRKQKNYIVMEKE